MNCFKNRNFLNRNYSYLGAITLALNYVLSSDVIASNTTLKL